MSTANPRPTLDSVAVHAGVSRQTVSNALNAPDLVRRETLDRVLGSIAELGYRPHLAARQLRTGESRVVGLRLEPVHDGINGAVLDRFLHAFTEAAQLNGYRVMLFTADDDAGEIRKYGELLTAADLDGFVLTSTHHDDPRTSWLAARGVPFVTFGRPWTPSGNHEPEHPWVDVDGAAGTRAATEHLRSLGHERIAFLGWPAGSDVGDDRRAGWRDALPAGAPTDLDRGVPDGVPEGAAATAGLLSSPDPPTAVVCGSDSLALGAVAAAATADRPDLAIVGFDDTPIAAAVGLTSVAQPLIEVAQGVFDLLQRVLAHPDRGPSEPHRLLTPRLVVRSTQTLISPTWTAATRQNTTRSMTRPRSSR